MTNRVAVFGGNVGGSKFRELTAVADRLKIKLEVISFKELVFETESGRVFFRNHKIDDYDVYFFRNNKIYWEETSLILDQLGKGKIVIDPVIRRCRQSDVCKANQMLKLSRAGLLVPKTVYGSLEFLEKEGIKEFDFPVIIKGSRGDRRRQVFKIYGQRDFDEKIKELKEVEKRGENKYMLQKYIVNTEDYRVMVLGDKVLGVMRRAVGDNPRLKDRFEKSDLPDIVKEVAVKAARICGIAVAGVDVVFEDGDFSRPVLFEVNKTPNYTRFEEVTGIRVAEEVVKFLANIKNEGI